MSIEFVAFHHQPGAIVEPDEPAVRHGVVPPDRAREGVTALPDFVLEVDGKRPADARPRVRFLGPQVQTRLKRSV
jgi:hypothetical protein